MRLQRNRFSKTLNASDKRTNNHPAASEAKAAIRAHVLANIGAEDARVFDAFAGAGEMHKRVWHQAAAYAGCDQTWYRDDRECFVADNRLVMRAIDLGAFNIFDLDAWGSPWEQVLIVAARRKAAEGRAPRADPDRGCGDHRHRHRRRLRSHARGRGQALAGKRKYRRVDALHRPRAAGGALVKTAIVWIARRFVDVILLLIVLHLLHQTWKVEGSKVWWDVLAFACLYGSQLCRRRA